MGEDAAGRLLTAAEVASRLGVAVETVRRLGRRGVLPVVSIPGVRAVRYRPEDVECLASIKRLDGIAISPPTPRVFSFSVASFGL